jgi:hypothetical protein
MTYRLTVPRIFWEDHAIGRACSPDAIVIRETARTVVVDLTDNDLADLRSDAAYYVDSVDFCGEREAYRSLINSARATVRALERQTGRAA